MSDSTTSDDENVGIAFALVIGAGAATGLGAAVVFFPPLVKLASRRTLAAALGLSAGVMTYVSFVEIFAKSMGAFEDAGHDEDRAYIYASLSFFAGVVAMIVINHTVTWLLGGHHHHHHHDPHENHATVSGKSSVSQSQVQQANEDEGEGDNIQDVVDPRLPNSGDLAEMQHMAAEIDAYEQDGEHHWEGTRSDQGDDPPQTSQMTQGSNDENKKLMRMSLNTALAIGLHNFPEGLATFVATLSDPSIGAVLAVAIAIHNIPEGLCVAMPVYYATGNKMKAFGWALVSGIAEPIAALLGWAVLANSFSDIIYGILFGVVSGMMVIISVRELLPTAHRYDPEDSVVTFSFMVGMAIMAASLVLFII